MYNYGAGAGLPSDADLLSGLIARQPAALLAPSDRYCRLVYSLALGLLGDAARAEECIYLSFARSNDI